MEGGGDYLFTGKKNQPTRVANSLFLEWRGHQRRPEHATTTDFQTLMAEEHRTKALRFVLAKRPSLKNPS
jgi:hypothetical protein